MPGNTRSIFLGILDFLAKILLVILTAYVTVALTTMSENEEKTTIAETVFYDTGYRYFHVLGAMYITRNITQNGTIQKEWNTNDNRAYMMILSDILEDVRTVRASPLVYSEPRILLDQLASMQNLIVYELSQEKGEIKGPHGKTVIEMCKLYESYLFSSACKYYLRSAAETTQ